jgi:HEAT repeat protein
VRYFCQLIIVIYQKKLTGPVPNVTNLRLNSKHEARNPKQIQNSNVQNSKQKFREVKFRGQASLRSNPDLKEEIAKKLWELYNDAEFELIRNRAIKVLGRMKPQSIIDLLLNRLKDSDPDVRVNAADTLGAMGSPEALTPLLEALHSDTDSYVRGNAADALGAIGSPEALTPLLEALRNDTDSSVRRSAASGLGAIGSMEALPLLFQALNNDKDSDVRGSAAEALGKIGDDTAIQPLKDALEDEEVTKYGTVKVKDKAFEALEKISRRTGKRILSRK